LFKKNAAFSTNYEQFAFVLLVWRLAHRSSIPGRFDFAEQAPSTNGGDFAGEVIRDGVDLRMGIVIINKPCAW
jgi:hypothetical protein